MVSSQHTSLRRLEVGSSSGRYAFDGRPLGGVAYQSSLIYRAAPGDVEHLPEAGAKRAGVHEPKSSGTPKMPGWSVLIIDDDLDTRANLRDVLELDSYRVVEAESVTDALEESNWSECLAILLNRRLRNESMALLLPRLRQVAPNSAVIVVTAHDDVAGAIEALRQGAIDYLLKPINPDELRARLGRVAEHRRLEEQQRESDRFARSVLDSLSANVAVLDDSGGIVAVNRAWRNFAVANGTGDMSVAEGANYFDVCAGHGHRRRDGPTVRDRDPRGARRPSRDFRARVPVPCSPPAALVRRADHPVPRRRPTQGSSRACGHHRPKAR